MKVLMIKDVGGVGRRGEIKEITDGYALNNLIPRGLAVQATPEKIKAHEAATQQQNEQRAKEQQALIHKVQSLENARIELSAKATQKGGLFKSLGITDIKKAILSQRQIDLPEEAIMLEKPIKEIGDHAVEIKTAGTKARLIVSIEGN
ncbi:MAG: 50S ribosomal protein L9 [Candidatus Pacebacteria bacterium]|nr:50S ribosomal protein L9 [Candidatus Paceibacterota bacterium]